MYFYDFNGQLLFIDSGKSKNKDLLINIFDLLGLSTSDIAWFLATHGHKDHIGGAKLFTNAEKFIHEDDFDLLSSESKLDFIDVKKFNEKFKKNYKYKIIHLGHHTEGSIAIYDKELKALFIGDHICFFGLPIPDDNLVYEGEELREKQKYLIKEIVEKPNSYKENNLKKFFEGLREIKKYDIKYLCTGHGVILKDKIDKFIEELISLNIYN
ncbi:glyoxylase-like metal-dependent hydrolase (beta-lactamase superfamily II) [Halanaerobium congolense]|jgi:glyoxylase-like metal-dependent hydrolase (beta-lactamase superfamily II)|uniref:Glyoxylase-like metal-dependent hydrolase (Beta-lactamase superfamily II) n=1 Tax=Halanaerobium congolense TaxID=54121 RepID=A0A4R8GDE0_9FIRM|nr:MBL fold metallo-hydrolase [Halanaerobium congolense]TDX36562.1 glyoxylase-like metal-dependent hydrolase (beta-lactamase superfamily II) [Halanaerobium congolense]